MKKEIKSTTTDVPNNLSNSRLKRSQKYQKKGTRTNRSQHPLSKSDPESNSSAIVIRHIPYGFFEVELLKYFSQFGHVVRVRVARNRKTGNHKGWAFVLFSDADVAQLAAEAMNGYLMFEKRLYCQVVKNKSFPRCLMFGPRLIKPPIKNRTRVRHAMRMNRIQNGWNEEAAKCRLMKNLRKRGAKLAELGYQLPPVSGISETESMVPKSSTVSPNTAEVEEKMESNVEHPSEIQDKPCVIRIKVRENKKLTKVTKKEKRKQNNQKQCRRNEDKKGYS